MFYRLRTETQDPNVTGNYAYMRCNELGRAANDRCLPPGGRPISSRPRDVGRRDLDLDRLAFEEANFLETTRSCFTNSPQKIKIRIRNEIARTFAACVWIGRSISSSPDLSGHRDVGSRDLDPTLRVAKESNSPDATRSGFTNSEPKPEIRTRRA